MNRMKDEDRRYDMHFDEAIYNIVTELTPAKQKYVYDLISRVYHIDASDLPEVARILPPYLLDENVEECYGNCDECDLGEGEEVDTDEDDEEMHFEDEEEDSVDYKISRLNRKIGNLRNVLTRLENDVSNLKKYR